MSLTQGVVILLFSVFLYVIGSVIWNLYFHPLSKVPGPFFARISAWPVYYHCLKGDRHIWTWQCHEIYGPEVRYSPNGVAINSPAGLQGIYSHKANVQKSKSYSVYTRKSGVYNSFTTIDKAKHAKKRRVVSAAFSDNALKSAEPYIIQHVNRWCELFVAKSGKDEWSEPTDMSEMCSFLVFDILGELFFGRSFKTKEPEPNNLKTVPHWISTNMAFAYPISYAPFLELWLYLKPRGLDAILNSLASAERKAYTDFLFSCLRERIKRQKAARLDENGRKDTLYYILQAQEDANNEHSAGVKMHYPEADLYSETNSLVIAGVDTTAAVLSAIFFYLVHNPNAYDRLTHEIRSTFTNVEDIITGPKLASCRYLSAFIDETMRMNPPAPSDLSREVLSSGLAIDGKYYAPGTNVGTSLWALHHSSEFFPEPFTFRPERWIDDDAASIAKARSAFAPFSIGPRGCLGRSLASMELAITVARVLHQLDVRGVEGDKTGAGAPRLGWGRGDEGQYQFFDAFVSLHEGPMVQFRTRRE